MFSLTEASTIVVQVNKNDIVLAESEEDKRKYITFYLSSENQ